MRDSAIQLLESAGVKVEVRPVTLKEVVEANERGELKEVFGTGTAASISPVGELGLEDRTITINNGQPGEVAPMLFKAITDIQYGRTADNMGWTIEVTGVESSARAN
jgi:branched-chain amino acid aminotransferase